MECVMLKARHYPIDFVKREAGKIRERPSHYKTKFLPTSKIMTGVNSLMVRSNWPYKAYKTAQG